jgi:hypothetical protein
MNAVAIEIRGVERGAELRGGLAGVSGGFNFFVADRAD